MSKSINIEVLLKAAEFIEQQQFNSQIFNNSNHDTNDLILSPYSSYSSSSSISSSLSSSPENNQTINQQFQNIKATKLLQSPLNDYINDLSRNKLFECEYKEIPVMNSNMQDNFSRLDSNFFFLFYLKRLIHKNSIFFMHVLHY